MKIKIYLNDGEDHFFGFKNDFANSPELTMVHEFDLAEDVGWTPDEILAWVYQEFNLDHSLHALPYRAKGLRSISVGDVVSVGETAWSCENVGWERITTEELTNAIIWNDETESVV